MRGNPEASVKLVEFADFECPHCKQVVPIMREVSEKYGDKIAFYFKQYPLPGHELAPVASAAALAAHAQGKFWPMHDLIFENQSALSRGRIKQFADQVGVNRAKLEAAMGSKEIQDAIERDIAEANRANLEGDADPLHQRQALPRREERRGDQRRGRPRAH